MASADSEHSEPTFRVSEIGAGLKEALLEAFPSFWVVGEVQRARLAQRGHFYFELIEKGPGDVIVGRLEAVMWRTDHERVRRVLASQGSEIGEGLEIRCRAGLDFYPPSGRLQLVVRDVDAIFSLGLLARRRRETLVALEQAGLLERNRGLELSPLPLSIGLVTSEGSAAYHDFLATLRESGFAFAVRFVHASVQGVAAETELLSALAFLGRLNCDCVVVVRGGGSKTDLAAFDGRRLAEAVARLGSPVLAGLGHETDRSVVDEVAHTSLKTPTKVAEFLIARMREAEGRVTALRRAFGALARGRLELAHARLDADRRRLKTAVARGVPLAEARRAALARRLADLARAELRSRAATLDGLARLAGSLSPRATLLRGYSITRDASGRALRSPEEVSAGAVLTTQFADGSIRSRVAGADEETP